jgi:hypothetical protein
MSLGSREMQSDRDAIRFPGRAAPANPPASGSCTIHAGFHAPLLHQESPPRSVELKFECWQHAKDGGRAAPANPPASDVPLAPETPLANDARAHDGEKGDEPARHSTKRGVSARGLMMRHEVLIPAAGIPPRNAQQETAVPAPGAEGCSRSRSRWRTTWSGDPTKPTGCRERPLWTDLPALRHLQQQGEAVDASLTGQIKIVERMSF